MPSLTSDTKHDVLDSLTWLALQLTRVTHRLSHFNDHPHFLDRSHLAVVPVAGVDPCVQRNCDTIKPHIPKCVQTVLLALISAFRPRVFEIRVACWKPVLQQNSRGFPVRIGGSGHSNVYTMPFNWAERRIVKERPNKVRSHIATSIRCLVSHDQVLNSILKQCCTILTIVHWRIECIDTPAQTYTKRAPGHIGTLFTKSRWLRWKRTTRPLPSKIGFTKDHCGSHVCVPSLHMPLGATTCNEHLLIAPDFPTRLNFRMLWVKKKKFRPCAILKHTWPFAVPMQNKRSWTVTPFSWKTIPH